MKLPIRPLVRIVSVFLLGIGCLTGHAQGANFVRGDANGVGGVDMTDAMFILNWKFLDGNAPACEDTADANDDGVTDMSDALSLLNFLFLGKAALPAPYPECGIDPTDDELSCTLGVQYGACENQRATAQFFFPTEDNSDSDGLITGRILDEDGNPLPFFRVSHAELLGAVHNYMTDADGYVTIESSGSIFDGTVTVTVHAQNPVVRMLDGNSPLSPPVLQNVTFADGETVSIEEQSEWYSLANDFRNQYDDGLREFGPWGDATFPNGDDWDNDPFILVRYPDLRTHVDPFGVAGGPPMIRLTPLLMDASVRRHELGHALHFSKLSHAVRTRLLSEYLQWVVASQGGGHSLNVETSPLVAVVEGFAAFAGRYAGLANTADKHEQFFASFANNLEGADVEGAFLSTIFVDFAQDPAVGLDYAVTRLIECEALTIFEYAECIREHEGEDSAIYEALLVAGVAHDIALPGSNAFTGNDQGFDPEDIAEQLNDQLENPVAEDGDTGNSNNGSDVQIPIELGELIILAPTIATVTIPPEATKLQSVELSVTVTGGGLSRTIPTVIWNFGDGQTATGTTVSHSYFLTGDFTVTVTLEQGGRILDSASGRIEVSPLAFLEILEPLTPNDLIELPTREGKVPPRGELPREQLEVEAKIGGLLLPRF